MLNPEIKTKAIALLASKKPVAEVAETLGVSIALVDEWSKSIPSKALIQAESVDLVVSSLLDFKKDPELADKLNYKMLEAALELVTEIQSQVRTQDMYSAQVVKTLSQALSSLTSAFKPKEAQAPTNDLPVLENEISSFERVLRD